MVEAKEKSAVKYLLGALELSYCRIAGLREREIELLRELIMRDETIKAMTKTIADLTFKEEGA